MTEKSASLADAHARGNANTVAGWYTCGGQNIQSHNAAGEQDPAAEPAGESGPARAIRQPPSLARILSHPGGSGSSKADQHRPALLHGTLRAHGGLDRAAGVPQPIGRVSFDSHVPVAAGAGLSRGRAKAGGELRSKIQTGSASCPFMAAMPK